MVLRSRFFLFPTTTMLTSSSCGKRYEPALADCVLLADALNSIPYNNVQTVSFGRVSKKYCNRQYTSNYTNLLARHVNSHPSRSHYYYVSRIIDALLSAGITLKVTTDGVERDIDTNKEKDLNILFTKVYSQVNHFINKLQEALPPNVETQTNSAPSPPIADTPTEVPQLSTSTPTAPFSSTASVDFAAVDRRANDITEQHPAAVSSPTSKPSSNRTMFSPTSVLEKTDNLPDLAEQSPTSVAVNLPSESLSPTSVNAAARKELLHDLDVNSAGAFLLQNPNSNTDVDEDSFGLLVEDLMDMEEGSTFSPINKLDDLLNPSPTSVVPDPLHHLPPSPPIQDFSTDNNQPAPFGNSLDGMEVDIPKPVPKSPIQEDAAASDLVGLLNDYSSSDVDDKLAEQLADQGPRTGLLTAEDKMNARLSEVEEKLAILSTQFLSLKEECAELKDENSRLRSYMSAGRSETTEDTTMH